MEENLINGLHVAYRYDRWGRHVHLLVRDNEDSFKTEIKRSQSCCE